VSKDKIRSGSNYVTSKGKHLSRSSNYFKQKKHSHYWWQTWQCAIGAIAHALISSKLVYYCLSLYLNAAF